jgi:hypothetical protein
VLSLEEKATMAELREIQNAIGELSPNDREALLAWLIDADRKAWDEEIGRDFSDGGAGMKLLADIDAQIDHGNFRPLE